MRPRIRWRVAASIALCAATLGVRAAVSVVDDAGTTVTLARPAHRIVSLAPHATELLYAAGAGSRVVGVAAFSDYPPEARALPQIGDVRALDLERIVQLAPDLVVAWPYTAAGQIDVLRQRGFVIFVSDPKSIAGIADDVEKLGVLAGTQGIAAPAAAALRERATRISARYRDAARIGVFYEVWNEPLYTIGGQHPISEAIALCGGTNVFARLTVPAPAVSAEAVLAARPEAIVAGSDDGRRPAWLDEWRRWPALPAVAYGNLLAVDGNLLHRPGPRFLDGVADLCERLDAARSRVRN